MDAVRWFGAVQSQDLVGARWALGQRVRGATDAGIQELLDAGAILRTHVMRPTWHFVLPEDIRWLIELTAPRVQRGLAGRYRQLGIDDKPLARATAAIAKALVGHRYMTRAEIAGVLRRARIAHDGQRLPHFLLAAELEGLVASGPQRGRDVTYGLLDELAPPARALDRSQAVAELARRYFRGHGPARIQDFVWWSGLSLEDARAGIAVAGTALERLTIRDIDHWSAAETDAVRRPSGIAHLLPNFDELTVGYRHRDDVMDPRHPFDPSLFAFGSILANVVTIDGRVRGAWRRTAMRDGLRIEIRPLGAMTRAEKAAVEAVVDRMGRFVERSVDIEWALTHARAAGMASGSRTALPRNGWRS